ncbi:bestrophin-like domain [Nonomuraea cavernae]|uniref:DUF4239 domain-containing protein n=1 Tax=Nonomuraea cavernae TaxID=2045107 RepID=A0A917YQD5_9ACTN|nr:DUF4239 domain-containing protein [Nonomuraea cavernae]MCA2184390.1 DUF4239 domain-containing protein [Nonomuraea cavernae]GGO63937.1 hypothetical protein GCM10012289_12190 [Nonomuraea cavernae]
MIAYTLAVAAAVGVVALAALLFRFTGKGSDDPEPGGTSAGHAGSMLSALFLLVFAIAIIVPWTTADAARQNTHAESQAAIDAYWSATDLPAPDLVRAGLRDYVAFVVRDEWPVMGQGRMDPVSTERLEALRTRVIAIEATDDAALNAKAEVLEHLATLAAARAQRTADAASTPPPGVLVLTILTGAVVIVFPFLAGARPRGAAILPLVAMAAMLGFGTYLTWDISHVFDGPLAVEPEAFRAALQQFARISGGV